MNKYVTPSINYGSFTKSKHYKIREDYGDRVFVIDDNGVGVIVRVDGKLSHRLNYKGTFKRCSELLSQALNIAGDAQALAAREAVRDTVANAIKNNATLIAAAANPLAERLRKAEHEAAQHKADCIKAEAVIDQLYDLFPQVRNHDQLIAAVKRAKIFSDAFIELQKIK